MKRIQLVIFAILGLLLLSLFIFGDTLDKWILSKQGIEWLRQQGALAGFVGAGLIVSDLFLPVPAPGLMTALGQIYGWFVGGLYATLGSTCAGLLAYFLVRGLGQRAANFIAGSEGMAQLQHFFEHGGAWAIALTRMLPVIPEVLCCLAGLARMPFQRFLIALLSGSVPMAFVFAGIGKIGEKEPITTILLATALPILIFPPIWLFIQKRTRKAVSPLANKPTK